jgi:hypothetical protein
MLVIPPTDPNYLQFIPNVIDDAELSIYRTLDFLATIVRDNSGVLTPNTRSFTLPQAQGRFVVVESINVGTLVGNASVIKQLVPTTREFLDAIYGFGTAPAIPTLPDYYAMITDQQIIVGPPPDAAYPVQVIGTIRPTPLSAANTTTYLTQFFPDLFLAESLIFGYGYLKDFGAATDDPQGSPTWVSHYKMLWDGANTEENRKKYASQGWTPKNPAPLATPPRA